MKLILACVSLWWMFEVTKFKLIVGGVVLFLIIASIAGYFFFTKARSSTEAVNPDEVSSLLEEISNIYELPTGETPTVATITDVDKLKNQPFFEKAKNGDKVIIYNQAKKAILYDPISRKILEVAPLSGSLGLESQTSTQSGQTQPPPEPAQTSTPKSAITAKIALRNGAGRRGLAATTEEELKKTYPDINVVAKDNVDGSNLDKTIVVVLNDKFKADADKLKDFFEATIADLPKGETKIEEADIMVILGRDRL